MPRSRRAAGARLPLRAAAFVCQEMRGACSNPTCVGGWLCTNLELHLR